MNAETPTQPMIVGRGILPVESKCVLGGAAKSNKSYTVLNMGLSIASGEPLFGARYPSGTPVFPVPHAARVLLIEQEIGGNGLKGRLKGILTAKPEWQAVPFYIVSKDLSLRMDTDEGIAAIEREIEAIKPKVLILDPLSKMHLADENSAQEMGAVMRTGDHWIEKYKVSIIYVHHTGLAAWDPANPRRGGARLRGSSVVFADVDTMIEVNNISSPETPEPTLTLGMELRQGEPMPTQWIKRLSSGLITWQCEKGLAVAK